MIGELANPSLALCEGGVLLCFRKKQVRYIKFLARTSKFIYNSAMKNPPVNSLTAIFLVILVGGASFYIYRDLHKTIPNSEIQKDISQNLSTAVGTKEGAVSINTDEPGQNYKIESVPDVVSSTKTPQKSPKTPNLKLPVVNYSHIDNTAFEVAAQNIGILANDLQKDPKDELKWLNLAIFRKMLGDYQASVEILNYIAILWPKDYVPYNNLADLYQFYLKTYPLAEKNWLKVIELKPDYPEAYENLFNLYASAYKEKQALALPILLKGLTYNPRSTDLMLFLARYYRSVGDTEKATTYYNKAIDQANLEKNEQVETSLRSEMSEMSK